MRVKTESERDERDGALGGRIRPYLYPVSPPSHPSKCCAFTAHTLTRLSGPFYSIPHASIAFHNIILTTGTFYILNLRSGT